MQVWCIFCCLNVNVSAIFLLLFGLMTLTGVLIAALICVMHENDLETILRNFCRVLKILAVISVTYCVAFGGLRRMRTYLQTLAYPRT